MARTLLHKTLDFAAHKLALGFLVATLQIRNYTFVSCTERPAHSQTDAVVFVTRAVKNDVQLLFAQLTGRLMDGKTVTVADRLQFFYIPRIGADTVVRPDRAFS